MTVKSMKQLEDLSTQRQSSFFRDIARTIRAGGKAARSIKLEYHEELAAMADDFADRIEAGDDDAEEESQPRAIIELMRQENAKTLGELFERYGIVFEDDLPNEGEA